MNYKIFIDIKIGECFYYKSTIGIFTIYIKIDKKSAKVLHTTDPNCVNESILEIKPKAEYNTI